MQDLIRDRGAGEPRDVLDTGVGPVVDDEKGEEGCPEGVEIPEGGVVPDQWEEEGEGVEYYVGFTVWE